MAVLSLQGIREEPLEREPEESCEQAQLSEFIGGGRKSAEKKGHGPESACSLRFLESFLGECRWVICHVRSAAQLQQP